MSTRTLALILEQELDRLAPRYASVCAQHPPLSAYPALPALVSRLADPEENKSEASKQERSVLLAAVIAAFQPTHDRLWGAILVAAFRPIVATTHLYGADPEEREGIFFAALVEVVDKLDVRERPDEVHAAVWRAAKRALVRKLRRHAAWTEVGFGDDADLTPDHTSFLPEPYSRCGSRAAARRTGPTSISSSGCSSGARSGRTWRPSTPTASKGKVAGLRTALQATAQRCRRAPGEAPGRVQAAPISPLATAPG
jgi:hypothetical protein